MIKDFSDLKNAPKVSPRDKVGPLSGKTELDYALLESFGLEKFPSKPILKRWKKVTLVTVAGKREGIALKALLLQSLSDDEVSEMNISQFISYAEHLNMNKVLSWHNSK